MVIIRREEIGGGGCIAAGALKIWALLIVVLLADDEDYKRSRRSSDLIGIITVIASRSSAHTTIRRTTTSSNDDGSGGKANLKYHNRNNNFNRNNRADNNNNNSTSSSNNSSSSSRTVCFDEPSSPHLSMFTEELPILPTIFVSTTSTTTIGAYRIKQRLHANLPPTTLYAFGVSASSAQYPGPILEARQWIPARIRWENHIPDRTHMLPVDTSIDRAEAPAGGGVPMVVHLHGAEVSGTSDGNPDAWFTARGDTGPKFTTQVYDYPNQQPPCMLWYHDHTVGMTRLNVAAGLFGPYIIRSSSYPVEDLEEQVLKKLILNNNNNNSLLPQSQLQGLGIPPLPPPYYEEVVLVLQDKRFLDDGRIRFPNVGSNPGVHPVWCPDYFGDTMLVNGKIWPFLRVHSSPPYRFRMLNANTDRFLNISFQFLTTTSSSSSQPAGGGDLLPFLQIGTDGGYLTRPRFRRYMLIAPAERIDIIFDFSGVTPGSSVILTNSARAPFPNGNNGPGKTANIMKFIVLSSSAKNAASISSSLSNNNNNEKGNNINNISEGEVHSRHGWEEDNSEWWTSPRPPFVSSRSRTLTKRRVHQIIDVFSPGTSKIPVQLLLNYLRWTDPVTEIAQAGSVEVWELINLTDQAHPIHIHLVNFVVTSVQMFDPAGYTNSTCSLDVPYPGERTCFKAYPILQGDEGMPPYLEGWKDTVIAMPGFITRLALPFIGRDGHPFPFDPASPPGYLWHCHLLGHEDNDMMRPLYVLPAPN